MKKMLALLLAMVILICAVPVTARAAQTGEAAGELSIFPFIAAFDRRERIIYSQDNYFDEEAVKGVSYDEATNTLTIENYNNQYGDVYVNNIAGDVTLVVKGDCAFEAFSYTRFYGGGSLTVTGDGTLTVGGFGVRTYCADDISVNIDNTVTMHVSYSFGGVNYMSNNKTAPAFYEDGKPMEHMISHAATYDEPVRAYVFPGYNNMRFSSDEYELTRESDPRGVYCASPYMGDTYKIERWEYFSDYDACFQDMDFTTLRLTEEEMAQQGFSYIEADVPVDIEFFTEERVNEMRQNYGYEVVDEQNPDKLFVAVSKDGYSTYDDYYIYPVEYDEWGWDYVATGDPVAEADYYTLGAETGRFHFSAEYKQSEIQYYDREYEYGTSSPYVLSKSDIDTFYVVLGMNNGVVTLKKLDDTWYDDGFVWYDWTTDGDAFTVSQAEYEANYTATFERDPVSCSVTMPVEYISLEGYIPDIGEKLQKDDDPGGLYAMYQDWWQEEDGECTVWTLTYNNDLGVYVGTDATTMSVTELEDNGYSTVTQKGNKRFEIEVPYEMRYLYRDAQGDLYVEDYNGMGYYKLDPESVVTILGGEYYTTLIPSELDWSDLEYLSIERESGDYVSEYELAEYHHYPAAATVWGDVDGDGELKAKDRIYLTRHLARWSDYTEINTKAADLNLDGKVNAKDRIILTRHLAKWSDYKTLPIPEEQA